MVLTLTYILQISASYQDPAAAAVTISTTLLVATDRRSYPETVEVAPSVEAPSAAARLVALHPQDLLLSVDHPHLVTILAPVSVADPTPTA